MARRKTNYPLNLSKWNQDLNTHTHKTRRDYYSEEGTMGAGRTGTEEKIGPNYYNDTQE